MSIYQFSKDDIASMVSTAVGSTVLASHFDIIGVRASKPADNVTKNTKIRLKFNGTGTYTGTVDLFYDRLDLSAISNFSPYSVNGVRKASMYTGDNLYDVLSQVRDAIGIQFTTDDLVAATAVDGPYGSELTLTAKASSPGFTGTYTLRMSGYPNIITAFFSASLSGSN